MTPKELEATLKVLRHNGVTSFKSGDLEISLSSDFLIQKTKRTQKIKQNDSKLLSEANSPAWMNYTPEQLATWSSEPDSQAVGE